MQCRLFTGSITVDGNTVQDARFTKQGTGGIVYVIDEIAIKNIHKHRSIAGETDTGEAVSVDAVVDGEFRPESGYSFATFLDKAVKPVHLKTQIGIEIEFPTKEEALREFAKYWRVQVELPPGASGIPTPAYGVLVPAAFEGDPPPATKPRLEISLDD